jgi:undecaprenyl-diphosphatase
MNDVVKAIILGIVEGITEFLPISSTGHLILVNRFIAFNEPFTKTFDIVIQLGAILSVVVYFRRRLFAFGKENGSYFRSPTAELWKKALVGVIPALIIGAKFGERIEHSLFNWTTVAVMLVLGGVALILLENRKREARIASFNSLDYGTAFAVGVIQCFAMIPGTSRSAATIIGAIFLGCSRIVAVEFSFFLAIPTMVAASGYSLMKHGLAMTPEEVLVLSVGFLVSFIVALFVVAGLMSYISRRNFKPFGYYRIVLGVLVAVIFAALQ